MTPPLLPARFLGMGRPPRIDKGGYVYHVLNRGNGRMRLFDDADDYAAFERVMEAAAERVPGARVVAYTLMPNHWHLVLHPRRDGELSRFVGWLTLTHTQRWHAHRHSTGGGHVYQGRYKSFLVGGEGYLVAVCRYVERNALRANLVERAEDWPWSSLWRWHAGTKAEKALLSPWPVPGGRRPRGWLQRVNAPQSAQEVEALRLASRRGRPYGSERWQTQVTEQFGLSSTYRSRGRPRKEEKGS